MIEHLDFRPFPGITSPHLQMILSQFIPKGVNPSSSQRLITLAKDDLLSCEISTPPNLNEKLPMIMMLHGLGGSHLSSYMVRISRKFFNAGYCVVRVNLRGCGSGKGLATMPYNGGTSQDILTAIKTLRNYYPDFSPVLLGFSLGGNIAIKLAGELGKEGKNYLKAIVAICPSLDLYQCIQRISNKSNWIYHQYYLKFVLRQAQKWVKNQTIKSIYEFDNKITAPLWGYKNAVDYYEKCSSHRFIDQIDVPCRILLAEDDPFVEYQLIYKINIPKPTTISLTQHGAHMGFLGRSGLEQANKDYFWMDNKIFEWIHSNNFNNSPYAK